MNSTRSLLMEQKDDASSTEILAWHRPIPDWWTSNPAELGYCYH
ncbi:MAG: hypothetical protein WAL95_12430 [Candidatus Acidiferrales bacterium]